LGLRFVSKLAEKLRLRDINSIEKFFYEYLNSLASEKPVVNNVERVAGLVLQGLITRPVRVTRNTIRLLKTLLGNNIDPILFPSQHYKKQIENVFGVRIEDDLEPELVLPFRVGSTYRIEYNPEEIEISSENLLQKLEEIYFSNPKAVVIVSKFIDWRGFYRFAKILEKVSSIQNLPKTYVITADPILEEIKRKYNLYSIPTKSHVKILAVIYDNIRYCYLGSMNVLSPSKKDDFLLAYPGTEKYCMKYLLSSVLR